MILKLNVLQRLLLSGFMNEYALGGLALADLSKALKLVDKFTFKEEEQKELNVHLENKDENGVPLTSAVYRWNRINEETKVEVDYPREIELNQEQADLLKSVLSSKNEKKEFTIDNGPAMFEIAKELGLSIE